MTLRAHIRRQIGYAPFSREPKASAKQLDYLATLLAAGVEAGTVRWDTSTQEAFTSRRASMMIKSLTGQAA